LKQLSAAALVFSILLLVGGCVPTPNTADLDRDISLTQSKVEASRAEQAAYSGGAIHALIGMRLQYQEVTLALLELKRQSVINFVELSLNVDGAQPLLNDASVSPALLADIAETEQELVLSETEASKYSGGLIHSVKLMEVATHKSTLASLNMRRLMQRWGIPPLESINPISAGIDQEEIEYFDDEAL